MRYFLIAILLAGCGGGNDTATSLATGQTDTPVDAPADEENPDETPAEEDDSDTPTTEFPAFDAIGNNEENPEWGSAGAALIRLVPAAYADGIDELAGQTRPNPRTISNLVFAPRESIPNRLGASDMFWQWGQFLDHDIDLSPEADPAEHAGILVPSGDPLFDPDGTGSKVIPLERSAYVAGSAPRQQTNALTAFIDASNVYGSDEERARALRSLDGTGRLKTSDGDLLPFNRDGLDNAGGTSARLFVAGDVRANEQMALTAMHVLFVREHNRIADRLREQDAELSGDEIYQRARRMVAAQMQVITYREFLPLLLGPDGMPPYRGYDETVDAGIANVFSTAAFRLGHSLLSPTVLRLDAEGNEIEAGHLSLREAFFRPDRLVTEGGIDPILRGLSSQVCQELDAKVVEDVRSFLFGEPGFGGLDLPALNIQRGREHGLPSYNDAREALGLARRTSFAEINADTEVQAELAAAYPTVDDLDVWVGGLAEEHRPGAMVGELFFTILRDQFTRLRDGDRFWYARVLSQEDRRRVERTRLSEIIRRNTEIGDELRHDVFRATGDSKHPHPRILSSAPIDTDRPSRIARQFQAR
ncbi:MAG: peroxidase family protein [Planctomycetota bacterium]